MKISKNLLLLFVFSLFILLGSGCRTHRHNPQYHKRGMIITSKPNGKVPPGQVKKMTGEKSAKAYAPGQNKGPKAYTKGSNKPGKHGKSKPTKYNKGKKRR